MKLLLTLSRSTAPSILCSYIASFITIIQCLVFLTPSVHSLPDHRTHLEFYHQRLVEEFKSKVLQHMGLSAPPRARNNSRQALQKKLLKELYRKKFGEADGVDSGDLNDKLNDKVGLHTVVSPSTDSEMWAQVQPANTPPHSSWLTVIKFTPNLQQLETPYHKLLIKSAILRMCISRQKRKFRVKSRSAVNISVYLLSGSELSPSANFSSVLIHSQTLNHQKITINTDVPSNLLANIVESDDKTVTIGVKFETVPNFNNDEDNIADTEGKVLLSSHPEELVRISRIYLQMTTQIQDLRRTRRKRQNEDSPDCTENTCCRHSVYVDFAEIGWSDWVLAPAGYMAYFCKGDCPDLFRVGSSFTGIKSLLHERYPDVVPGPVCAPTGYRHLDLTIWDEDDEEPVKDVSYPGMVVTGCRCF